MRSLLTIALFSGIICLSACSKKDDSSTNLLPVPSTDSVSKGSFIQLFFSASDSLYIKDLAVKGVPIEGLSATDIYDPTDSTYVTKLILSDSKQKIVSLNLTAKSSTADSLTTVNTVVTNSSTFTDYRNGENKTYAIQVGSTVTITQGTYPIQGTLDLILRYNTATKEVTGKFYIYR